MKGESKENWAIPQMTYTLTVRCLREGVSDLNNEPTSNHCIGVNITAFGREIPLLFVRHPDFQLKRPTFFCIFRIDRAMYIIALFGVFCLVDLARVEDFLGYLSSG